MYSGQLLVILKWRMSVTDPSLLSCLTFYSLKDLALNEYY